ncbi:transporter [Thermosipho africanus H17ap60334]|uniref:Probable membrane transporter protein n=1 Tax=Thermosipho africanus (strain TCF52B) TaxID=484019 RepID=B7IEC3_THEAB|nr:TSUP family transporter [Thermosipho africanus]ACJ76350.1 transporter [Thermosipho africanus TCF52B]EKF49167.1 transporter [Thermosipho africanus H17ap60334]RDI91075.1 transporter [Thermosipho africanus Ob7]
MHLSIYEYLFLFFMIFLAGFVDSIAGGGGLISLPAYLFLGIPSHNALATNKLSSSIGSIFSTFRYAKERYVVFEIGIISAIFSFLGSFFGARLALLISDSYLKVIISVLIVFAGAFMLMNKRKKVISKIPKTSFKKKFFISSFIGFIIGMYDGFFGPGTGTFLIIMYTSFLSFDSISASATAKIVNLSSNISALIAFLINGKVLFHIGLPAAFFGILGNWIGSGIAIKKGDKIIKPIVLVILFLVVFKSLRELI